MTRDEFLNKVPTETIQQKVNAEWRWKLAEEACAFYNTNPYYIQYNEEEDRLYLHVPLE